MIPDTAKVPSNVPFTKILTEEPSNTPATCMNWLNATLLVEHIVRKSSWADEVGLLGPILILKQTGALPEAAPASASTKIRYWAFVGPLVIMAGKFLGMLVALSQVSTVNAPVILREALSGTLAKSST